MRFRDVQPDPLWIILALAAWSAISAHPRPRRQTPWGWIVVGSGIVLLSGLAYVIVPALAGYVATGLALVLIALPSIDARLIAREVAQQCYDSA